jgi:hypothetical protein
LRTRCVGADRPGVDSHLGEALDAVRKSEYGRLAGRGRRYIKGQKYTLLPRKGRLVHAGKNPKNPHPLVLQNEADCF